MGWGQILKAHFVHDVTPRSAFTARPPHCRWVDPASPSPECSLCGACGSGSGCDYHAGMARPLRINAPGLTYHITARGTGRMTIYRDDHDRLAFLDRLAQVVRSYGLECHAYCLMDTHYHLVVTTGDANVSRAVQHLNVRTASGGIGAIAASVMCFKAGSALRS